MPRESVTKHAFFNLRQTESAIRIERIALENARWQPAGQNQRHLGLYAGPKHEAFSSTSGRFPSDPVPKIGHESRDG